MAAKKKAAKKEKTQLGVVNIKMTEADRKRLQANARKFAKGNLSAWIRHAAKQYVPAAGEKIRLKAA